MAQCSEQTQAKGGEQGKGVHNLIMLGGAFVTDYWHCCRRSALATGKPFPGLLVVRLRQQAMEKVRLHMIRRPSTYPSICYVI